MPELALRFAGVVKNYGRAPALRNVTFEVERGEFFGLVGVNGAGKTTLLKCLLDFCDINGGSIEIFGTPHHQPAARKRLSFLPERFTPPYYLTGEDFIRYVLDMQAAPYDRGATEQMLRRLDLDRAVLAQPVRAYSKGMTQKLGLAACFLSRKELFVLDEPMSGLDPSARVHVKNLLQRLKNDGKSLVFTSHSLADIDEICDHMVVLHCGSVVYSGSPGMLLERQGEPSLERAFLKCIESNVHGR